MIIVDFESRSRCDLTQEGAYNYALHPSTEPLCCAFVDTGSNQEFLWTPDEVLPKWLIAQLRKCAFVAAHNAQFDRLIWEIAEERYGFPHIGFDRWYCTSAQCRVNGLPASLEDAARALDTNFRKDVRGKMLIKQLCIPRPDGTFCEDPLLLEQLYEYCLQDARVTKDLVLATRMMSTAEHLDWLTNEKINERGVLIDVPLAIAAQDYATAEYIEIADELSRQSNGVITKHTQTVRAASWIAEQLGEDHPALRYMTKYKDGEPKLSLDKNIREELLDAEEREEFLLPDEVFNVVCLLHESSQSSVTKFKSMAKRADIETHRLHGAFIYAGASQTLRFSSRGLQMHNMPQRGGFKTLAEATTLYQKVIRGEQLDGPVMPQLKNLLRYAIRARDDYKLVIGDWVGVEARVLPWLADTKESRAKLNMLADGIDVYQLTAEKIGYPDRREVGKVTELALGYQGAVNAFKQFARGYGMDCPADDEIQKIVYAWRDVNEWAVAFWYDLEYAARSAIMRPNRPFQVGKLKFLFHAGVMGGTLFMILPDGGLLSYPQARIEEDGSITALKASVKASHDAKHWPRDQLYGGKFAGHGTQGTAACLLRNLLRRAKYVIAHVHDEVILEVPARIAENARSELKRQMAFVPDWADGLILESEPVISERYGKY